MIVLTLPITRSWTIGGKASTISATSTRWLPIHRFEYQTAITARTPTLKRSQTQTAASSASGTSGAKTSAPIGV